jgi:hypothetical protein
MWPISAVCCGIKKPGDLPGCFQLINLILPFHPFDRANEMANRYAESTSAADNWIVFSPMLNL